MDTCEHPRLVQVDGSHALQRHREHYAQRREVCDELLRDRADMHSECLLRPLQLNLGTARVLLLLVVSRILLTLHLLILDPGLLRCESRQLAAMSTLLLPTLTHKFATRRLDNMKPVQS